MTGSSEHRDVEDLLGAYALHALGHDERLAVERHLTTCPMCREEVDAHWEIAAALGQRFQTVPPELWDRIADALSPPPPVPPTIGGPRPVTPLRLRQWSRPARLAAIGAAAAAVAAICVLAVSLGDTNQQLDQARRALGTTAAAFQHALTVPGHRTGTLRTPSGNAITRWVVDPGGRGYLLASDVPVLPADRTYQLWAIVDGRPISIGLLGTHPTTIAFAMGSAPVTQVAMTIEPAGGSQTPTLPAVATATI